MNSRVSMVALCVGLAVAGCGNSSRQQEVSSVAAGAVKDTLGQAIKSKLGAVTGKPSATAPVKTPTDMPPNTYLLKLPKFGYVGTASPIAANQNKVTWISDMGASISVQQGFVIATRGFGDDLMSVEVDGFGAAFVSGGKYLRMHEHLNGLGRIETQSFTCTIESEGADTVIFGTKSYESVRYRDTCEGDTGRFTNFYWLDSTNKLRQTQQWIAESVGYLQTQAN